MNEHDSAILRCFTSGTPKVKRINWFFGDKQIDIGETNNSSNYFKNFSNFYSLDKRAAEAIIISDVTVKQAGLYSCVAIQSFGKIDNISQKDIKVVVECIFQFSSYENISIH
jgi:Immunoglobulin domain